MRGLLLFCFAVATVVLLFYANDELVGVFFTDEPSEVLASTALVSPTRSPPPRRKTFRYFHIPKTGTSFIILLRNYLEACTIKHFSCPGVPGGGKWATQSKDGKAHAVSAPSGVPITLEQMKKEETCDGHLHACVWADFHVSWNASWINDENNKNIATMLRDPLSRFLSWWNWAFPPVSKSAEDSVAELSTLIEQCLENTTHAQRVSKKCYAATAENGDAVMMLKMFAGQTIFTTPPPRFVIDDQMMEVIRRRLFEEVTFFGLTEYWAETVCTFHCELGGEPAPSEYFNTRENGSFKSNNATALSDKAREHIMKLQVRENQLYQEAKVRFLQRAADCGCLSSKNNYD